MQASVPNLQAPKDSTRLGPRQSSVDQPKGNGIRPDVEGPPLLSHGLGQAHDSCLARCIVGLAWAGAEEFGGERGRMRGAS